MSWSILNVNISYPMWLIIKKNVTIIFLLCINNELLALSLNWILNFNEFLKSGLKNYYKKNKSDSQIFTL